MFDTKRFLEDQFVSADGLVGSFNAFRMDIPSRDTVRKWFERGSVPSDWLPLLICVRELETGEPVKLAKYLK